MAFPFILRSTCNHLHWPQSQECVKRAINVIVSSQNAVIKSFKTSPHMMSVDGGRGGGRGGGGAGVAGAGSNCSQRPLNQKAKRL